ncbi:retron St85 family effector protein [Pseudomonas aeruginosa]
MRDAFCLKVDLSISKMKPYEGFIFLCGGPSDVTSTDPVSIRDAIQRELVKHPDLEERIRIAEDYKDWSHDSIYRDLVSFETHLAELSSVIVLILESPGSLTELGLFSIIDEFKKKLLVIVDSTHYQSNSFIRLGPIDFLEKNHGNSAECHRWLRGEGRRLHFDAQAAKELQPELAEAIRLRASRPSPERLFNPTLWLDGALLTCDLLSLCSALTLRELKAMLEALGCPRSESEIRQTLFVLERVRLISMEPKGDQRFYISRHDKGFVRLHITDDNFDPSRFRSDLLERYEKEDKKRFRAIQEARRRHA